MILELERTADILAVSYTHLPSKHAAVKPSSPSSPSSSTLTSRTMNRYLVPPGKKLRLKDYSPDEKSLFSGTKEESLIECDKLGEELQELQKKLFAQHKHCLLYTSRCV